MRTSSKTHKCDEGGKQKRIGTGKDVEIMVTKAPAFVNRDFHDQDVRPDFKPPIFAQFKRRTEKQYDTDLFPKFLCRWNIAMLVVDQVIRGSFPVTPKHQKKRTAWDMPINGVARLRESVICSSTRMAWGIRSFPRTSDLKKEQTEW